MAKDKHTKGPWKFLKSFERLFIIGPDGDEVLSVIEDHVAQTQSELVRLEADMLLMASAPELLSYVKKLSETLETAKTYICDNQSTIQIAFSQQEISEIKRLVEGGTIPREDGSDFRKEYLNNFDEERNDRICMRCAVKIGPRIRQEDLNICLSETTKCAVCGKTEPTWQCYHFGICYDQIIKRNG